MKISSCRLRLLFLSIVGGGEGGAESEAPVAVLMRDSRATEEGRGRNATFSITIKAARAAATLMTTRCQPPPLRPAKTCRCHPNKVLSHLQRALSPYRKLIPAPLRDCVQTVSRLYFVCVWRSTAVRKPLVHVSSFQGVRHEPQRPVQRAC